ncbi:putative disease resistance RPP13-like protein 1 [Vitis vinifera]|uniref:Putative disease resistance RPP13-like protein 1 n=1 Tax=Vitis vinifera TaxID=29760 RepID=A0A438IUB9_VITVI|nr:putative disease resistance RPP13-like protein 1 [Vitis vinifera]
MEREMAADMEGWRAQIDVLGLEKGVEGKVSSLEGSTVTPSTPLVGETIVYSKDKEKEEIVEFLLSYQGSESKVDVISIVGMGGAGKTTLAQLVYNDKRVQEHFDLRVWVCVSDEFDVARITMSILYSVSWTNNDLQDFGQVQVKLRDALAGKKFLLVLDDVWNEEYSKWDILRSPFEAGAKGSKIIITTRSEAVAMIMGRTVHLFRLGVLSEDDCWSLFAKHAFKNRKMDQHPNLEVAKEIAYKCKGLPLAAKVLGQLLQSEPFDQWETVLNSEMWTLADDYILPHLRLTYSYLPFHLKRCFAYCALFPMDYEFEVNELVFLWMAEGLIQQPEGNRQMEDLGVDYFHELRSRSFFQQSSNESKFVMRDLICDLARASGGDMYCILEDGWNHHQVISEGTHHFSFACRVEVMLKQFETFKEVNFLRTFLAVLPTAAPEDDEAVCNSTTRELDKLLAKFKRLRILSLRGCQISELPHSIGNSMYLRYLNLSLTAIKGLPDSVGTLFHLQTLLLHGCKRLTELPRSIGNLTNLRHLDITDTDQLQKMPPQIGNLIDLRSLPKFIVSKDSSLRITALRNLSQLRGKLSILGLHYAGHIWPSCDAILRDTEGLEELLMEWVSDFSDSRNERDEVHVLDLLEPHTNLKKLMVSFYGGSKFPSWIGSSSFSNMVDLNLNHCKNCTSLSSLGRLSSLKSLCIAGMGGLKRVGAEFYGEISPSVRPFSSLETLIFEDMPEWKNWSFPYMVEEVGAFPCLRQLTLINCPKLIKLPCHPPSLVELAVCECAELAIPLRRLASVDKLSLTGCCRAHLSTRDGVDLSSLINTFNIQEIPSLTCREDMKQFLEILQHLEIYDCACLEKLPDELQRLVSLTDMRIEQCPKLVSLPGIFPPELRSLSINCCESLKWLPDGILTYGNSSNSCLLEHLEIRNCPSLACFPTGDVRNSLQQLEIEHCVNLESLAKGMMRDASINPSNTCRLQVLKLYRCSSLRSFPAGKLPSTLKRLEIWDCTQLDGISEKMLQNNTSLECLDFWNYPNLKTLPRCLTPYLKNLHIGNCVNFEFQSHLMQSLSSIQSLCIRRCPGLKSFQEGDLSPSLTSLQIEDCQNLKSPLSEWNLHRLTSLTGLRIGGLFPDVVLFSAKQGFPLLPTTLTHLSIDRIQNLESLVSLGLQNLTSLKELRFTECLKLHSFLPSEGLPSTVSMLFIRNCPLLSRSKYEQISSLPSFFVISRETVLEMKNSLSNGFSLLSLWHVLTLKKMLLEALSHTFNGMPVSVVNGVMLWKFSTVLFQLMAPKVNENENENENTLPLVFIIRNIRMKHMK